MKATKSICLRRKLTLSPVIRFSSRIARTHRAKHRLSRPFVNINMTNEERPRPPPEPPPAGASLASLVTSTHKSPPASTQVKNAAALGKAYAPERGTVAMSGHSR